MDWIYSEDTLPMDSDDYYVKILFGDSSEDMCTGKEVVTLHNRGAKMHWRPFINSHDIYKEMTKAKGG